MNVQLSRRGNQKNAKGLRWSNRLLSLVLLSACLVVPFQVWATTIEGERFTLVDDAWGFMGYDLDVDGETAAVGAWYNDGAVHLYERESEDEQWTLATSLSAPEAAAGLNFGFNVWLNNDQLIVGAPNIFGIGPPGAEFAGKAFIYERDDTTGEWLLQGSLSAGDQSTYRTFGREVVIEGNRAFVSVSPGRFLEGQESVFVFDRDPATNNWNQTANILISENEINTQSITDVTLVGNQLLVATSDSAAPSAVRVFNSDQETGAWLESGPLIPGSSVFAISSNLGLSTDGNSLLVTDPQGASYYLFERDQSNNNWVHDPEFTLAIATVPTGLGKAAALDSDKVVVADANNNGADVYQRQDVTGQWIQVANLSLGSSAGNSVTSVSVSGNTAWLGTPYLNGVEGSAHTYQLDDDLIDLDADGIPDADDNCPLEFNPSQSNYDGDLLGDACDLDDDNDGVDDEDDAYPYDETRQEADPSSTVPAVPERLFPSGNAIRLETAFFWPAVAGADYYVIEVQHKGSIRAYEPMIPAAGACRNGECVYYKTDAVMMGDNRWRLRAGNSRGISAWSSWSDFVVSLPAGAGPTRPIDGNGAFDMFPSVPVPTSPSGSGYSPSVKFQWPQVPGVIDYAIEIQHDGLIRGWEPVIPAAIACVDGSCEFVMTHVALPGVNRWRLSARNDIGQTQWSDWVVFAVTQPDTPVAAAPAVPEPNSPQGNGLPYAIEYIWEAVDGATHYAIEIQHDSEITGYDNTIRASSACEANICRYAKADAARTGSNRWRLGSYSNVGFSGWSQWQTFTVD